MSVATQFVAGTGSAAVTYPLVILPNPPKKASVILNERHVPGGNINYVDVGGLGLTHLTLLLRFADDASQIAFEAAYGQVGTLTNFDGHVYQAILMGDPSRQTHGVLSQYSEVSVEFLLLSQIS